MVFEKINVNREGAVLFAAINAPPMNLEGPELVRDLVSLIQRAKADDTVQVLVFESANPDYFISHVDVTRIKSFFALYHGMWPVSSEETSWLSLCM